MEFKRAYHNKQNPKLCLMAVGVIGNGKSTTLNAIYKRYCRMKGI